MSSVKIILSGALESKDIRVKSDVKNDMDLYYCEFEHTTNLIDKTHKYSTSNNFVNGFLHAYNGHKYIRIRPDDIKQQYLMVISTFINNNAEIMKDIFVGSNVCDFYVESTNFSVDYFCDKFSELLEKNIKCPEFAQHIKSKFSTTNRIIQTVNNITLMNTLKEYFSYTMILGCGIPGIILEGSCEDWLKLRAMYDYMRSLTVNSELKDWYKHFDTIINMFIDLRQLRESGVIEEASVPDNVKELFKRVITYIPEGSGDDQILGGWIRLFCPYSSSNSLIKNLDKSVDCLDITKLPPVGVDTSNVGWQTKMRAYYLGSDWSEISSSFMTTPAKLIVEDGTLYEVEFYSGFFEPHLNDSDEIMMNIGYILRENQELKKAVLREYYTREGVIGKEHGYLTIPKRLKPETTSILEAFNAYSYCFYGIDAVQEEAKRKYLKSGVEMIKSTYSYKYRVPEKLRCEKDNIMRVFETNERHIIFKQTD